ncbi:group II intron reverse transcriptase/maturase [Vampirovibrio sp.]|uniref:group II intron reverse transcriptase/maturase n=1 Tax=Vampirovibrio sp. TaxID=2717857 RepID=UPI0035940126
MSKTKPFAIPKALVVKAYELVKANKGAAGIDRQSLSDFDKHLKDNLYRIWNRLSSGSYFPPAVRAVPIPKKQGGERILGIPTVSDRIAQMVVKLMFEPTVEPHFHPDSYGYRPNKSALDAIGVTRQRCWRYNWVIEYDIKGLFDNIDHELLMKAVRKHTSNKWVLLYIERWLKAPMQLPDGTLVERTQGTPQGGVISPVLSNLFLHYVVDAWMSRTHPKLKWCRYADDGLIHCRTEQEAQRLLAELKQRFEVCKLELHPTKTKIIYCKDAQRKGTYLQTEFDFLGYTFRPRLVKGSKRNQLFVGFNPAVSKAALKSMRALTRDRDYRNQADLELQDIANMANPVLRGWIAYYGRYSPSSLYPVFRHFNCTLVMWAMRKYKRFRRRKTQAAIFLENIAKRQPDLFVHWKRGMVGAFA